jgi:thymidylate kinase
MLTVALIGPDGAGKTTISSRLEAELGVPVKPIYMGVNLHSSGVTLPHMRLVRALRLRADAGNPDARSDIPTHRSPPATRVGRSAAAVRASLRLANWLAEESYRLAVAAYHKRRGTVVVFDRHFFADHDAAARNGASRTQRLHGYVRRNVFPKPDLVIFLDAPAELLHARKPEGPLARVQKKRQEYLDLHAVLPDSVVVDAGLPVDEVAKSVAAAIRACADRKR